MLTRGPAVLALLGLLALDACSSSDPPGGKIRSLVSEAAEVSIGLVQPGQVLFDGGLGPGGVLCGTLGAVRSFRTDRAVVFRARDTAGFCFDTDVYKVALRDVTWKGEAGTVVFATRGDPAVGNGGRAVFFAAAAPDVGILLTGVTVLQGLDGDVVVLSIPLEHFGFWEDPDDAQAVFDVQVLIERDDAGAISEPDATDRVLADFVDGP